MPRSHTCICAREFETQKQLSMHENSCTKVAARDQVRYTPYYLHRKDCTPALQEIPRDAHYTTSTALNTNHEELAHSSIAPHEHPQPSSTAAPAIHPHPSAASSYPVTRSRARRIRASFREDCDALPEPPAPLDTTPDDGVSLATTSASISGTRTRLVPFETAADTFGRFRVYPHKPTQIPDSTCTVGDFFDPENSQENSPIPNSAAASLTEAIAPFPNLSTFYLARWFYQLKDNGKSQKSRDDLVNNVILQPQFNPRDFEGISLTSLDKKLAETVHSPPGGPPSMSKRWTTRTVSINVPRTTRGKTTSANSSQSVSVPGLRSRRFLDIMRQRFENNNVSSFQYVPYEDHWTPPGAAKSESQRIYGEFYTSQMMIDAHKEVQHAKIENAGCTLPRVVGAYMLGSDGLQLGQFSHTKGWLLYAWLGNDSKYERCKPSSKSCFEVAHLPSLPDNIKDILTELHGRPPAANLLTHLRRELMHAVLRDLLDDKFLHTWQHGVVIKCADGVTRRIFPRIFTYSADYPERVLIATIRDKGQSPCPRCLVSMNLAHLMGSRSDMRARKANCRRDNARQRQLVQKARALIYSEQRALGNAEVEALLQPTSLVPTINAFSQRLSPLKFDFYKMFVPDVLHEVELGVWNSTVAELNKRFRLVPTFGNSTIRLFSDDVASMSRLAARDFEDLLQ
ncbi:hypothetical protein FRC07_006565, partial [Ceratobasidium sp. 392]